MLQTILPDRCLTGKARRGTVCSFDDGALSNCDDCMSAVDVFVLLLSAVAPDPTHNAQGPGYFSQ